MPRYGDRVTDERTTAPRPGVDVPDDRGRIGLDAVGRALDRNPDVVVRDVEVVSNGWHVLRRTERVHFSLGAYTPADRVEAGGGVEDEGEDIEVLEVQLDEALAMVADGRIADGKTIMLLQWVALRRGSPRQG